MSSGPDTKTFTNSSPLSTLDDDGLENYNPVPLDADVDDDPTEPLQHLSFSCPVDHAGSTVHVQGWMKIASELPPVIFVHDLGENSDLYAQDARILARFGFNTYSFDMRGHGRSTPLENKVLRFDDLVQDLLQVVAWIRYKSQRKKPFLIGQGVGALVLMHFQKYYPQFCSRCVMLAPVFEEQTALPFINRLFLRGMANLSPKTRLPATLLPYFLPMSDESHLRADRLFFSSRFTYDLMMAIRSSTETFFDVTTPNMIVCPNDDSLYNAERLRRLVGQHPHRDVFVFEEVSDISSQAFTRDVDEAERLLTVVSPWLLEICPPSSLL